VQISVVLTLCHSLAAIPQPVCREEIVAQTDTMAACIVGQPAIADWKSKSIYRSDAWTVTRIKCVPGEYVLKDSI
jgi:hypothetical protein